MERYPVYMDWYTISIKIPMPFPFKNIKIYPKIHIKVQGTSDRQNSLENKNKNWRSHAF